MSVDQRRVVDALGVRGSDGFAVLTIADDLPWDSDNHHLLALQNKINDYLAFLESGEVYGAYPEANDREIEIQVVHRFPPVGGAVVFLQRAGETVRRAGFHFAACVIEEIK